MKDKIHSGFTFPPEEERLDDVDRFMKISHSHLLDVDSRGREKMVKI